MFSTVSSLVRNDHLASVAAEASSSSLSGGEDIANKFEIDFWKNFDDDLFNSPLPFDASEGGLWNGRFVPPPPRPPYLDDTVISDGLTTCDLCTWAFQDKNAYSLEGSIEAAGELGWAFTIAIVSVVSALLGAIIMITLVRCRRLKSSNGGNGTNGGQLLPWWCRKNEIDSNENHNNVPKQRPAESLPVAHANPQVWIWLKNVNTPTTPEPIPFPPSVSIENYYTNTDDNISSPSKVSEVVYEEISGIG